MGTLKTLPGVIDTSARDAPGWGSVGGMTINGQSSFNFSYDGVDQQGHRIEFRQLRRARARLDRRSQSAVVEFPGRVRPQLGRDDHRRHQERHPRASRARAAYYKRDEELKRTRGIAGAAAMPPDNYGQLELRKPPYRFDNTAWTIGGPLVLPGTVQQQSRQAVLLLLAGPAAAQRSGQPVEQHDADGARAQRRFLADRRQPTAIGIWIKDPLLAAQGLACNVNTGGPGCFANNIIPANRINAFGQQMLNLFPMPNCRRSERHRASTTTRIRTSWTSRGTTRCCASTGTSSRRRRSTRACSSATR